MVMDISKPVATNGTTNGGGMHNGGMEELAAEVVGCFLSSGK
jgi:hypothetical protein